MALRRFNYGMHHAWITSTQFGGLMPCFVQEVTPGDTWSGASSLLTRFAPLDVPAYVAANVGVHFFFVPHRLVWPEFEDVITGADTTSQWPGVAVDDNVLTDILPYVFGIGTPAEGDVHYLNALPFRAYNLVWNEYFRDQQVQDPVDLDSLNVQNVNFPRSDYFAKIRAEYQQGDEESIGVNPTVSEVRDAFRRQKFKERRSQFGERYYDLLSAMGIKVPASRLDRPEHVARGRGVIGVSEVVATASSENEQTGEFAGHGIAGIGIRFKKRMFVEHGTLLGVFYVRPRNQFRSRVDALWRTFNRESLYTPELANGNQVPVHVKEFMANSGNQGEDIIGYTARDEWLRSARDVVASGMMNTANAGWTASRKFEDGEVPSLSELMTVPNFEHMFQDQTWLTPQIMAYFDHRISKQSQIPRRKA